MKFGNNEIKMLKNQTNNHHVQKDIFEFVEMGTMNHRINVHYEVNKKKENKILLCLCNLICGMLICDMWVCDTCDMLVCGMLMLIC